MKYAITGVDGKLCSRVVNYMLDEVDGHDLILTCYRKSNIRKENLDKWEKAGAQIFEADYDSLTVFIIILTTLPKYIRNFLICSTFTGSNLANSFQ